MFKKETVYAFQNKGIKFEASFDSSDNLRDTWIWASKDGTIFDTRLCSISLEELK